MIVTARFEIADKAAPHLVALLRDSITPQILCKLLEVSHAEQVREKRGEPVQPVGRSELAVQAVSAKSADADGDSALAGAAGKKRAEPGKQHADERKAGPVPSEKGRGLIKK